MIVYYTGVGSRDTPEPYFDLIKRIAAYLAYKGCILRSGGADGADSAFEEGCDLIDSSLKEIYLPWKKFNHRLNGIHTILPEAYEIAKQFHPAGENLRYPALKFHGRNVHQVLGRDLYTLSQFLICWTPGGKTVGGTATAINIAKSNRIPVMNLADYDVNDRKKIKVEIDELINHKV